MCYNSPNPRRPSPPPPEDAPHKRSRHKGNPLKRRVAPACRNWRKPVSSDEDPEQLKIKKERKKTPALSQMVGSPPSPSPAARTTGLKIVAPAWRACAKTQLTQAQLWCSDHEIYLPLVALLIGASLAFPRLFLFYVKPSFT